MLQVFSLRFVIFLFAIFCGCPTWFHNANAIDHSTHLLSKGVEIDRVDFTGVTVFSSSELEKTLEIGPGDPLERSKLLKTAENLQALYLQHGYRDIQIKSRLVRKRSENNAFETVLEFAIKEGSPLRIASVHLQLKDSNFSESTQKEWEQQKEKLELLLPFSKGDVFNQEKMNAFKQAIQDHLAQSEFIGVVVEERKRFVAAPPGAIKTAGESHWVEIEFSLQLGDRVSFGFRGNTVFTQGYLSSLINEQRVFGLGKDYLKVILEKLEEEYRSAGYAGIKITPYTFEEPVQYRRRVTFMIHEGPKVRLGQVQFDGNSIFSTDQLRSVFFSKAETLIQNSVYVEKEVRKASELLIEWMKEQGYLSARVIAINVNYPPKPRTQVQNSSVNVLIYLYEGDQTLIDSVSVSGVVAYPVSEVMKYLNVKKGAALNLFALGEGIETLKRMYRSRGYLNFKVVNEHANDQLSDSLNDQDVSVVTYSNENRLAQIRLEVEEGPQFRLSRIEIEGAREVHERVVLREVRMTEGAVIQEADLVQTERQIRKLGIFSSVEVKLIDDASRSGYKIARIHLNEAERGVISYGPGLRNDLGIRVFSQLAYNNLWGENHTVSLSANANRRFSNYHFGEGQAQLAYSWPWFGIPELNFKPTAAAGRTQYVNFSADNYTLAANWDKQLFSGSPTITGYLSYTWESITQFNATLSSADNGQYQIATITPKIACELRASSLAPTRGCYSLVWADIALPLFGSQGGAVATGNAVDAIPPIAYYRAQMRNDYYWPLGKDIVWYFSFRVGYEQTVNLVTSSGTPSIIPLIKEFALGGINSIRGYAEQSINNPNQLVGGSLAYVNYRTQMDMPFSGALKFGLFADAGNLLVNNFSFGGLNYGVGFGFHYQTPVGPINFDWGFPIDPPATADPFVIHFSVGVI